MRIRNIIVITAILAIYIVLNILYFTGLEFNRNILIIGPFFSLLLLPVYQKISHGIITITILIVVNLTLLHFPMMNESITGIVYHVIGIPLAYIVFKNKQMSRELNIKSEKLHESNETKTRLFSILSHDLRNSVGGINELINILVSYYDEYTEDQRIDFLETLQEAGNNTYSLLENLLFWVREQAGESKLNPAECSPKEIARNAIENVFSSVKSKDITIINNIEDTGPAIFDSRMIQTVLRNFLSNAVKFTPSQGVVILNMEKSEEEMIFSITDTGVGIPDDVLMKLFKKNEETTSFGTAGEKGIGIGLKICHQFVKKHKGDIWIDTEVGKGTTFYFNIPLNISL